MPHCHHFSICNHKQSISISVIVAHFWQNTKAIALLFGQHWLILITCQSAINSNQCQFRSFFVHVWAKYQGYSLTFWPKLAHCHHLSICNQNQSISISVIVRSFVGQNTQTIALLSGQNWLIYITFTSQSINVNFGHMSLIFGEITKAIVLLFGQNWPMLITCHSAININQCQCR